MHLDAVYVRFIIGSNGADCMNGVCLLFDSYLVDPASGICLFQRLSHACLSMR